MANSAQARKRARQAEKNRQLNAGQNSRMRTFIKKLLKAVEDNDKASSQTAYKDAVSLIDRAVNQGQIHKNKAARQKSRLNARVRAIS